MGGGVGALDLDLKAGPPRDQLSDELGAAECVLMPLSWELRGTGATLMWLFGVLDVNV